jgi:antirestriction protein ArdC
MPEPAEKDVSAQLVKLGVNVQALRNSDDWKAYLRVARSFHSYSPHNQILIWSQFPTATRVAGYRKWLEHKRQVRKGERSIKIFAPMIRKNDIGEKKLTGFRLASVFDISQTEGDPLPEVEWPKSTDCPEGLFYNLRTASPIPVLVQPDQGLHGGARGWLDRELDVITVIEQHSEAANCAVLVHELGHYFDPELRTGDHRADELVAESAGWIAAGQMGLGMTAEVEHYLASWEATPDLLVRVAQRVHKAATQIVALIDMKEMANA